MTKYFSFLILLIWSSPGQSQQIPTKEEIVNHFGFEQEVLSTSDEDIYSYMHAQSETPTKLIVFIQGSDPGPQFGYRLEDGQVKNLFWNWGDYKSLSEDWLYVIVEKLGFESVIEASNIPEPAIYFRKNSLHHRVNRIGHVLNNLVAKYSFEKVVLYGHSEGAPVAAKLASVNHLVTHLGFWCGNAMPDFYDFIIENRILYHKGEMNIEDTHRQINSLITSFSDEIAQDTSNTEGGGYTNMRWWSFAEPPLNYLLKVDIPIFVQVSTEDKSAPIESTFLIPLEFARHKKSNLTYKVCVGCDHGFFRINKNGIKEHQWNEVFLDFIDWTSQN